MVELAYLYAEHDLSSWADCQICNVTRSSVFVVQMEVTRGQDGRVPSTVGDVALGGMPLDGQARLP
ncbi:hypothetical protein AV521_10335 [Streptomyces sp. IMTB 2501]|nr:hypothetical protein AV521_10335 [Streptomyces sp. IMTB 2501]